MSRDGEVDRTLDMAPSDRVEATARFAEGATIGHFRVIRELGAGGMGVVFEAHDPDLDRRVAIKVVRDRNAVSAAGMQLIREAQAMARLAHPNVVAVHEVGTVNDQVFVVMELVPGTTLCHWLEQPRPWRDIVRLFVQAGEGLLAAHHAGLIHRDFKPSNVLLDLTGRVRVGDFGLARADDVPQLAEGSRDSGVAGTPAYMAPEQRAGDPLDARADQYAFGVSLQEALSRKHAIGIPPWRVRAAINRALAIDPEARFASMHELLGELRRTLRIRRRTIALLVATIALATTAGGLAASSFGHSVDDCGNSVHLVDDIWTPAGRASQLGRFITLRPAMRSAIASSAHVVDDWAEAWKLGRRAVCSADPAQRAARLGCLDQRLHDLRAQVAVWATADAAVVDHVVQAAASLPSPDGCASHPDLVAIAPKMRDEVSELDALQRSGRAEAAKARIPEMLALAAATGSPGDLGVALLSAGEIERETGDLEVARDHLSRAAQAAGQAGDDRVMLRALVREAVAITDLGRPRDSLGLLDAAAAINARTGFDRNEEIAIARADALEQTGRGSEALAELRRILPALEVRAARFPAFRIELTSALGELAAAQLQENDSEGARVTLLRTLALDEASYGPDHPEVAKTLHDLASAEIHLEKYDQAAAHLLRSRAILTAAYGEHHILVAASYLTYAKLDLYQANNDDARASYEHARTALTAVVPSDHPYFAIIEAGFGEIDRAQDQCKDAIPHFQRAIAIYAKDGHSMNNHAAQLTNLGACLVDVGKTEEAKQTLEQSLAEIEANHMPVRWTSEPLAVLADLAHDAHRRDEAIALEKRAIAALANEHGSDTDRMLKYERDQLTAWTK